MIEQDARILMDWFCKLGTGQSSSPFAEPIGRKEAIDAIRGKTYLDMIESIAEHFPQALKLYVGYPSYVEVTQGPDGSYNVTEQRYQWDKPGHVYHGVQTVNVPTAFAAMTNVKQRYDWEMSSSH